MTRAIVLSGFLAVITACFSPPRIPDAGFVSPRLLEMDSPTVAVLPFVNGSGFLGADYLLADEFNLRLGMTGRFRMVERERVKELYREQDFDPLRIDTASAVRAGRLLGAQLVALGTVTDYKVADRPPEIPVDAFPVAPATPASDDDAIVAAAVANAVTGLAAFLSMKPPVAEVGASVRLVSTESGEILWQARNRYRGDEKELTRRRPRETWDRLRKDVVFLSSVLASEMVATIPRMEETTNEQGTTNGHE